MLDTCVLWPSLQRDFLLSLGVEGLYRPTWSTQILEELEYHEAKKLIERQHSTPSDAADSASRLVRIMRDAFSDATISGYERLEGTFGLPDPDDEHVVAAAVFAGADVIVTLNFRDFPAARIPPNIETLGPAEFACNTVSANPLVATRALGELSRRRQQAPADILDLLMLRYQMVDAVEIIRSAAHPSHLLRVPKA